MKFGVCCSLEQARTAIEFGADYVELGAVGFNGLQETWEPAKFEGLPIGATNLFFPGEIRLFGEDPTPDEVWQLYVDRTLERAASLEVRLMVIGSGNSRKSPAPGLPVSKANEAFVSKVSWIQERARNHGITIAPESLNRTETNVGNDLGWMANALNRVRAGYTADSFHVLYEWDAGMREGDPGLAAPSEFYLIEQIPIRPAHVHFGDLPRFYPKADDPMMQAFCRRLWEIEYDGLVSLECRWDDFERELPLALDAARKLFEDAA
ncbi:MAG: TIM barrel protein [Armatimonadetes bacterium]|nr:TIM barrel protein [Armatimonadota bacterium]